LNELLYVLALCQYTPFDYTQKYTFTGYTWLALCIAGKSIFLYSGNILVLAMHRASPVVDSFISFTCVLLYYAIVAVYRCSFKCTIAL